nr:pentatricopeptide repeat-containing protein [Tanacetum cinerariifolium]
MYEHGLVYQWSVRKDNHLDLANVSDFLKEKTESIILYELFFRLPPCELDVGLKIIENERDLEALYDYAHEYGKIHVYITHGPQDLALYYVKNMCFYGSGDDVMSRRKIVTKDAVYLTGKGLAHNGKWLVDKGKGIMADERKAGRKTARSKNISIVIEENVNPIFSEDDDSDSVIDMEQMFKGSAELKEMYNGIQILKVGEKYVDAAQLKECLTYYSIANGISLWFYRSLKEQLIARCGMRPKKLKDSEKGEQRKHFKYPSSGRNEGSNRPFKCYSKLMLTESSFQVISLNKEHTCVRNFKYGNLVNYKWIGKHFGHKIRQNPKIKLHEIADLVLKKFKCIVSPAQCRNAKTFALNHGERTTKEHYAMIMSHGCRPVIALDGCFLKKPNVGEILTALELLGEDIDMPTGNGLTLISDQHKAVKDVLPLAEHRQYTGHIYEVLMFDDVDVVSVLFVVEVISLSAVDVILCLTNDV